MIEDKALTFRDFADSLRVEVSDIPPQKEKHIKEFVVKVKGVIERKYGKYFGPNTLNIVRGLEERVVSFAPGTFKKYMVMIDPNMRGVDRIKGAHFPEEAGDIIGIESRKYLMKAKGSQEIVSEIMSFAPLSKRDAAKVYKSMVFMGIMVHEIVHAYEFPGLPPYFSECAAPFYAMEIQGEMQQMGIIEADGKKRADFYEKFIKDFGEEVHGIFFGATRNKEFKKKVLLAAFTPEIVKETFPVGYGSSKNFPQAGH